MSVHNGAGYKQKNRKQSMRHFALVIILLSGVARAADFQFWPGIQYDPAIPTIAKVLGHAPGERISSHAQVLRYFEALEAAVPGQVVVKPYATSWEGRELIYAAIGNTEHIGALETLSQNMQALADPRRTDTQAAESLISDTPGSVWLSYAVHGDEISSTDAAMLTAYHLLAARGDALVDKVLAETVVFIDPMQNPDGRDRFIHGFQAAEGIEANHDRFSAEHDQPWPSGRVNHYNFDLNRDWLPLTQPETRGRVAALLEFFPLVFIDAHEMGGDSSYYFTPEALPYNPFIHPDQRRNLTLIGKNNARWFDRYGIDYFTREVFDAFYPGYGASWPIYYGALAATYEQASTGGLVLRQKTGKLLHYREAVRNHFVTSLSTAQVVAENREKLLRDFYGYRQSAIQAGQKGPVRHYLISGADASAADKLAAVLVEQGVEVQRAKGSFQACGKQYPAGSYAVSLAQGAHRLIRTVLDPQVDMEAGFVEEQERRRQKDLPDQIYDVTGWSLPLMYNLSLDACGRDLSGDFEPASNQRIRPGSLAGDNASVAYLVPWGSQASARMLTAALRKGIEVRSTDKAFRHANRDYPSGTLIIKTPGNVDKLGDVLRELALKSGAEVVGVSDSWVESGPNFGSNNVHHVRPPRVALLWDLPTGTYAAGNTRFVLERQFGYPVTVIRGITLAHADLSRYDVLILPESGWADYEEIIGDGQAIKDWVKAGGTLILLGNALEYATDPKIDLISLRREEAWQAEEADPPEADTDNGTVPGTRISDGDDLRRAIAPTTEDPDSVGGVLVHASVDPEHWLAAGVSRRINVLVRGEHIYSPLRLDQGFNVAHFDAPDKLLASGYLWQENRQQLAFKPFAAVEERGDGQVIAFTQDPNFRAYLDGLNLIFMNAVFRGPAHARSLH
jgi:hypothetical protein